MGETATLLSTGLLNSELRVIGFAPRQINRSAAIFAQIMNPKELKKFGWITFSLERLFFVLQYCSLANLLFKTRSATRKDLQSDEQLRLSVIQHARRIDTYIAVWFLSELLFAVVASVVGYSIANILCGIVVYRIFEIMQSAINMNIFDRLRLEGKRQNYVASLARTLILTIINFLELIMCFGVIYQVNLPNLKNATDPSDAYYFSIITQLTIGYGDISPSGYLKFCTALQGLFGFLFSILILGRLVSFLPRNKPILGDE